MESVNNNTPTGQSAPKRPPSIENTQQVPVPKPKDTLSHAPPFTIEIPRDVEQIAAEMGISTSKQNLANEAMKETALKMESNAANLMSRVNAINTQEHEKKFEERRNEAIGARDISRSYFERAKQETVPVAVPKEPWYKRGLLRKLWW